MLLKADCTLIDKNKQINNNKNKRKINVKGATSQDLKSFFLVVQNYFQIEANLQITLF